MDYILIPFVTLTLMLGLTLLIIRSMDKQYTSTASKIVVIADMMKITILLIAVEVIVILIKVL